MNSGRGPTGEMHKIVSEEGFRALWKGVGPAMTRASALTASQLATYDESKQALLRWTQLEEGFHLHLISSFVAGTVGTLVTAPVDMIKTRLMLQQDSRDVRSYRNVFHCAYQINCAVESVAKVRESSSQIGPPALHAVLINKYQKVKDLSKSSTIS